MKSCNIVYQDLSSILDQKGLCSNSDVPYLQEKGLISVLSDSEYTQKKTKASRLPSAKEELRNYKSSAEKMQLRILELEENLDSSLHKTWSCIKNFGKDGLNAETKELENLKYGYKSETEKIKAAKSETEGLEKLKSEIKPYVNAGDVYVRATEKGAKRAEQIKARLKRLPAEFNYDTLEKEIDEIYNTIGNKRQRFEEMYKFLVKKGFEEDNSKVIDCAISLSSLEGSFEDIYKRMNVINDHLYKLDWDSYSRLYIASAVAAKKGDIEELKKQLDSTFSYMTSHGHSAEYETWMDAARVMDIPGASIEEKFKRFDALGDALNKRGWSKNSTESCYVAAVLAKKEGNADEIAKKFREFEKKVIKSGVEELTEAGLAALVLMDVPGTDEEKIKRFNETFKSMIKNGWDNDSDYYTVAAMVSLMPGSVEENVLILKDIDNILEKQDYENTTNRALSFIGFSYKDLFKDVNSAFRCDYSSFSNYNHYESSLNSGCGFNMGWALIGDLIDNRKIDFSAGFFLGGIIGGSGGFGGAFGGELLGGGFGGFGRF